jgi:sugar lactone lactonase YvrE
MRTPDGRTRVVRDDIPGANGITFFRDRLFIDENRPSGRLLEFDLNGGPPRVVLENVVMPNALAPGPDNLLYYPSVTQDEIWRVNPDGGTPERVIAGLHHPVAVKFDSKGYIVSPQSGTGEILRIDPQSGNATVIAKLDPCLDNLVFKGDRLFVSHLIDGRVTEVLEGGRLREVLPGGMQYPLDLAIADDGKLYISDNCALYALPPGGTRQLMGRMFGPGYPMSLRGLAAAGGGAFIVTTSDGRVVLYRPQVQQNEVLAKGFNEIYGVAIASDGALVVAEAGAGRVVSIKDGKTDVLASGLNRPMGVAFASDGSCLVSETGAGRVVKLVGAKTEVVLDGLRKPHGIAVRGDMLYVVDRGAQAVIAFDMKTRTRTVLGADLPVGEPAGVERKLLPPSPFSGPLGPFAGIVADAAGTLYFSADAEGCVMALRPS